MSSRENHIAADFVRFMLDSDVLRFGSFTAKSGRQTPYFLDAGKYGRGSQADRLGGFYAERLLGELGNEFDVLFGPAYKGIPLVVATAVALSRRGKDVGFCFNRKEAKDHGEGGIFVGQRLRDGDRVVIVEDVTTAGTSIRETVPLLRSAARVELVALIVAVDRQERGQTEKSALRELGDEYGMKTMSIVTIDEIIQQVRAEPPGGRALLTPELDRAIGEYRAKYGGR